VTKQAEKMNVQPIMDCSGMLDATSLPPQGGGDREPGATSTYPRYRLTSYPFELEYLIRKKAAQQELKLM
jgi:hypothetical protein